MNNKTLLVILPTAFLMLVGTSVGLIALGLGLLEQAGDDAILSERDGRVINIRAPVRDTGEENLPYKTVRYNTDALPVACPPESECAEGENCPRHCGPIGGPRRGWPIPDAYTGARVILFGSAEHTQYAIDVSATIEDGKSLADFVPVYATMEGRVVERHDQTFQAKGGYGSFARVRNAQYACVTRVDMWEVYNEALREEHNALLPLEQRLSPDEPLLYLSEGEEETEMDRQVKCVPCGEGAQGCVVDYFCRVSGSGIDYCLRACEIDGEAFGTSQAHVCQKIFSNYRAPDYPANHTNISGLSERNFFNLNMPEIGYGKTGAWEVLYAHMTENVHEREINLECDRHSLVGPDSQCGTMGSTGLHFGTDESQRESMGTEPFVHYEIWRNINTPNIWHNLKSDSEALKLPTTDTRWGVVNRIEGDDYYLGNSRTPVRQDLVPGPCCPPVPVDFVELRGSSRGPIIVLEQEIERTVGAVYLNTDNALAFDAVVVVSPRKIAVQPSAPPEPEIPPPDWEEIEHHRLSLSFDLCQAGEQEITRGDFDFEITGNTSLGGPGYFWSSNHLIQSLGDNRWRIPDAFAPDRGLPAQGCRTLEISLRLTADAKRIERIGIRPLVLSNTQYLPVQFSGDGLAINGSVSAEAIDRQLAQCDFIPGIDRTGGYDRDWEGEVYNPLDRFEAKPYQCPAGSEAQGNCIRFFQRAFGESGGEASGVYDQTESVDLSEYLGPVKHHPQTPDIRGMDAAELKEYFRQIDVDISELVTWSQGKTVSYVPIQHISGYHDLDELTEHDNQIAATRYDRINGQSIITTTIWVVDEDAKLSQTRLMRWAFDQDNIYYLHTLPWKGVMNQTLTCHPTSPGAEREAAGMVWLGRKIFGGAHCHAYDGNIYVPDRLETGNQGARRNPSDIDAGLIDARWVAGHMPFARRLMTPSPGGSGQDNVHFVNSHTVMPINLTTETCCQTDYGGFAADYKIQLAERGSVEMCSAKRFKSWRTIDVVWPEPALVGDVEYDATGSHGEFELEAVYQLTYSEQMPHPEDIRGIPGFTVVQNDAEVSTIEPLVRHSTVNVPTRRARETTAQALQKLWEGTRNLTLLATAHANSALTRLIGDNQFNASLACLGKSSYQIGNESSCSRAPCCGLAVGQHCAAVREDDYRNKASIGPPDANACIDQGRGVAEYGVDLSTRYVEGRVPLGCYEMARTGDFTRAVGYWERLWCATNLCQIARANGASDGQCGGSCQCGHAYYTYWNNQNPGQPVPPAAPLLDRVLAACEVPQMGASGTLCAAAREAKNRVPGDIDWSVPPPPAPVIPEGQPAPPPPPPNVGEAYIDYDFSGIDLAAEENIVLSFRAGNFEGNGLSVAIVAFAKDDAGNINPEDADSRALVYRGVDNSTIFEQSIPISTLFSTAPFSGSFILRFYAYQETAGQGNAKGVFSDIVFTIADRNSTIPGVETIDYPNENLVFDDVVRLVITEGDRTGETYYFAKGTGLIGMETVMPRGGICSMDIAY